LERPELAADERFQTNACRVAARDELVALLDEAFSAKNRGMYMCNSQKLQAY